MAQNQHARGARRHRQNPVRSNRMTLVNKMIRAADESARGVEGADDKLYALVRHCLVNGNEPDLWQALAEAADNEEVFDELEFTVHEAAGSAFNVMLVKSGEHLQVELFAIPLLLAIRSDQYQEVPQALEKDDLDWLTRSFRLHGLKDPDNESVLMAPELWSAEELYNLPFHKVYRLAQAYGEAIGNRTPVDPEAILDTTVEPASVEEGAVTFCLRYVVGAFVHAPDALIPFQEEDNQDKLDAWSEAVEERLGKCYDAPVGVFDPDSLYQALEDGWFQYHGFLLAMERNRLFEDAQALPAEVTAVISLHGTPDHLAQVRVGYARLDEDGEAELIGGSIWPLAPFDDPADIADFLEFSMQEAGIGRVEKVPELQEEAYCEDCGEPTYPRPEKLAAPGPGAFIPASRHLH